jgi:hypothetical protein
MTHLVARMESLRFMFGSWNRSVSYNLNRLAPLRVDPTGHWYLEQWTPHVSD